METPQATDALRVGRSALLADISANYAEQIMTVIAHGQPTTELLALMLRNAMLEYSVETQAEYALHQLSSANEKADARRVESPKEQHGH